MISVAVTAVGGGVGQSVLKALKMAGYSTVGIDPSVLAMGLYYSDRGRIGKECEEEGYVENLINICNEEECMFLFSGLDKELSYLSKNFYKFKENNIIPIVSSEEVVTLSDDKWALNEFLINNNFPHIKTFLTLKEAKDSVGYPLFIKPRCGGCRSKLTRKCNTNLEARDFLEENPGEYIYQEYIDGDEYTCGNVVFDRNVLGTIVMRRILRDGDTYKAFVEKNKVIEKFNEDLLHSISPFGPCNVQLRMKDGVPHVLEINARCSGTTAARALAGFNEPDMICRHLLGQKADYDISPITILRYWNECVVEEKEIEEARNAGVVNWRVGRIR